MKKILLLLSLFCLTCASVFSFDDGYKITNYNFDAIVHENSIVSVTETIDVNFIQSRHGIIREIPLKAVVWRNVKGHKCEYIYKDEIKNIQVKSKYSTYTLKEGADPAKVFYKLYMQANMTEEDIKYLGKDHFDVSKDVIVEDHDGNEEFSIYTENNVASIRIGSVFNELRGNIQYTISYDIDIPQDKIKYGDIFYYSVLGSEWDTEISKFHFNITFEKAFPPETKFHVTSGYYGSTENTLSVDCYTEGNSVKGSAVNIGPYKAISLFADLPEGYYVGARKEPFNLPAFFPVISIIFSLALIIFALVSKKKIPVQTVEFYPPEGITSADVGLIIDGSADSDDILTLIPYWGSKGYIKIEQCKKYDDAFLKLTRLKELPESASAYETKLWDGLFPGRHKSVVLENVSETFVNGVEKAMNELEVKYSLRQPLYSDSILPTFLFIGNAFFFFISLIAFNSYHFKQEGKIFLPLLFMILIIIFSAIINKNVAKLFFKKKKALISNLVLSGLSLFILFSMIGLLWTDNVDYPAFRLFLAAAMLCAAGFFKSRLIKPTDYNIEISGKLLGLKDFIEKAELDKLKKLMDQDEEYFYNILPYAIAFGLEDKWIETFIPFEVRQPKWYQSKSDAACSPRMFKSSYNNLRTTYRTKLSEMSASSSSYSSRGSYHSAGHFSGGGGHGFSGGGHGGGGGHSW